jgi:hypothetical protein
MWRKIGSIRTIASFAAICASKEGQITFRQRLQQCFFAAFPTVGVAFVPMTSPTQLATCTWHIDLDPQVSCDRRLSKGERAHAYLVTGKSQLKSPSLSISESQKQDFLCSQ